MDRDRSVCLGRFENLIEASGPPRSWRSFARQQQMPREAQRHVVSNGSTTATTSLEEGNLERQTHHSSRELHEVYDRYITVCPQVMQRHDSRLYRLYKPCVFFIWTCPVFVEKGIGTLSGKTPALSHASGNPVESCSLDVAAVFAAFNIPGFSQISTSTAAVVVDVRGSSFKRPKQWIWTWQGRIMKRSTTNRVFSAISATFQLKENKQGPNLHLTETNHPPLCRNRFMHSRL